MSAFLTVEGFTLDIVEDGASQGTSTLIGKSTRAFSGKKRSSIRGEYRTWSFTVYALPQEDEAVFKAAVPNGMFAQCGGDALVTRGSSETVLCEVVYRDGPYVIDPVYGYRKTIALTLDEVGE